mgnify:CR=1 FL=1
MYRIMYMSTTTKDFTDVELDKLLERSVKNNKARNVTGLLVVKGRTFLQCLEGKKEDVEYIYDKIQHDLRHKDIIELVEEDAKERYFPNWSMGFKNIQNLTNIKSQKLIDFSNKDKVNFSKEDIPQLFQEFVEAN